MIDISLFRISDKYILLQLYLKLSDIKLSLCKNKYKWLFIDHSDITADEESVIKVPKGIDLFQ